MTPREVTWIDSLDYDALAFDMSCLGVIMTPEEAKQLAVRIVASQSKFDRTVTVDDKIKLLCRELNNVANNGGVVPPKDAHKFVRKISEEKKVVVTRYDRRQRKREQLAASNVKQTLPPKKRPNPWQRKKT